MTVKKKTCACLAATALAIASIPAMAFADSAPAPSAGTQSASGETTLYAVPLGVSGNTDPNNIDDNYGSNIAFSMPSTLNFAVKVDGSLLGPSSSAFALLNKSDFPISVVAMQADAVEGIDLSDTLPNDDPEGTITGASIKLYGNGNKNENESATIQLNSERQEIGEYETAGAATGNQPAYVSVAGQPNDTAPTAAIGEMFHYTQSSGTDQFGFIDDWGVYNQSALPIGSAGSVSGIDKDHYLTSKTKLATLHTYVGKTILNNTSVSQDPQDPQQP